MSVLDDLRNRERDIGGYRAAREEPYGDRAVGGRDTGGRTPTYNSELLHYREDYGSSMDDTQYEYLDENQEAFSASITEAEESQAADREAAEALYSEQKAEIDAATFSTGEIPSYEDVLKENGAVLLRFFDGDNEIGEEWVSQEFVNDYFSSLDEAEYDYYGRAEDPKGGWWINVKGNGGEMYNPIAEAQAESAAMYDELVNTTVADAQASFNASKESAYSLLDQEYQNASEVFASRDQQIQDSIDANQVQLDTLRNKYAQKLANMSSGITGLTIKGVSDD